MQEQSHSPSTPAVALRRLPLRYVSFALVVVLAAAVSLLIASQVVALSAFPFDTDEAAHALGGLTLAQAVQRGDLLGALRAVAAQEFYPPGVDPFKAAAFLLFGATPTVARLFSVASFFLAVLVVYALALEIDGRTGWLSGLVAALLTLTVQPLLLTSGLVMLEAPGLLVSFLWLWAVARALKRPSRGRLLLASLLLALVFLTKYTYGIVAVATAVLLEFSLLLSERPSLRERLRRRWLWLFGPCAALLLLWFGRGATLNVFLGYTQPLAAGEPWLSLRNLLFYPRSLVLHDVPSPAFALVTLASLVWATTRWHNSAVRLFLLYFLLGMAAIIVVNHPPNPRFIVTFVPAAHVLTGLMVGWLAERWSESRNPAAAAGLTAVALLFLLSLPVLRDRFALYPAVLSTAVETGPGVREIAAWVDDQVPDGEPILLVNYWDQFSPTTLAWRLGTHLEAGKSVARVTGVLLEPATAARTAAFHEEMARADAAYLVLLEGSPWGAPFWPAYTEATADLLQPVAQQEFAITLRNAEAWLEDSLLTRAAWTAAQHESRESLVVRAIIYKIGTE